MKLAGLDLFEISSGKRKGQKRISKRGRHLLRKILYNAAVGTIRKNGIMCDYYARLIARGMVRTSALIVVAKKLLRIIHAMLRDGRDYIHNYASSKRVVIKKAA
jgi:transposase